MTKNKEEVLKEKAEEAEEKLGFSVLGVYLKDITGRMQCVRTYSVETHGLEAKKCAEEYAKKRKGEVRKVE